MAIRKRKNIKIALERVSRTDLICVACGRFRTEWAIVVGSFGDGHSGMGGTEPMRDESGELAEVVAGVHTGCLDALAVRHTRVKRGAAEVFVGATEDTAK